MFINDWKDSGIFGMIADFEGVAITESEFEAQESPYPNKGTWAARKEAMCKALQEEKYQGFEILLASYEYECYEGNAFVLFKQDGKLFEVNASHCSCFGLEDQWGPEETTPEALISRKWGDGVTEDDVRAALKRGGCEV